MQVAAARQAPYSEFLDQMRSAPERVLLLDYDGTLAPFTVDRDHAVPYPEIPPLLVRIMETGTRLILITGRPARELALMSGIQPHPEIWGSHGFERLRTHGRQSLGKLSSQQKTSLLEVVDAMRRAGLDQHLELKPGGLAVHWRGLGDFEVGKLKRTVSDLWRPWMAQPIFHVLEFDGGMELRIAGVNKGSAVSSIIEESQSGAAIAYLGDDQTDEDAFRALKGKGLTILVGQNPRPTEADMWLKPPEDIIEFLRQWLISSGGDA